MTRTLAPLLLALAAATASTATATAATLPAPAPAMTAAPNTCGYYPRQNLKLRTSPGGTGIGVITPKDLVYVVGERGEWDQVRVHFRSETGLAAGTTGYVARRNLNPAVCMKLD